MDDLTAQQLTSAVRTLMLTVIRQQIEIESIQRYLASVGIALNRNTSLDNYRGILDLLQKENLSAVAAELQQRFQGQSCFSRRTPPY
jgi:hypothetical protein